MYRETLRQAWAEIDLSAFDYNIKEIKRHLAGDVDIIGVIKADAYGHDMVECARVLAMNGVNKFAVATLEEAIELREAGSDEEIIVIGLVPMECLDVVKEYNLTILIGRDDMAESIALEFEGSDIKAMMALDTGMGRIGYRVTSPEDASSAADSYERIKGMKGINLAGVFTHFATADEEDREYTDYQIDNFDVFCNKLDEKGITDVYKIASNSASIMVHPRARFNAVRPGIIMYGAYPSTYLEGKVLDLKPVMSIKAEIVHLKTVPVGSSVSYGRKFVAERETKIATLPLGYADGYRRALSGKAEVLVNGQRAPIIGNICMDQCMVDVTDIPCVELGQEVIIIGQSGEEAVTASELAGMIGTINYEITCGFAVRLPRVFINCPGGFYGIENDILR